MKIDDLSIHQLSSRSQLRLALVTETFPPEINGVAMTLGRIADGLKQKGHSVQMVRPRQQSDALDSPLADTSTLAANQPFAQALVRGLPIPNYDGLRFGLPARKHLTSLWQHDRPDLVHVATEGPLGWSAVMAARQLKIPVTSSFHTHFDHYSQHYGLGWLKQPVVNYLRKLHNRTAATFVPTQATEAILREQGYQNLHVLSRGVDADSFHPQFRSTALRQQWGLSDSDLAVIHVGRLAAEKNLALVERAFAAILLQHPTARLILVGDGPSRQQLAQAHPEYIFAGMRTEIELATHYASGDIFLFASLTETFGNVVLEAMASGVPVIAFACAGAAQTIEHLRNGMLVAPEQEEDFVIQALRLAADSELRQRLKINARNKAEHLSWDRIYGALEAHFLRIIRKHQRLRAQEESFIQLLPV
jgi:glycosyltransferase involved in cell wall biosynthesis